MKTTCSIAGCSDPTKAHELCGKHYMRVRRRGSAEDRKRALKGVRTIRAGAGYVEVVGNGQRKLEHIVVAERAMGKPMPAGAIVHHVNENRSDNRPANLVVCPSIAYHKFIHMRMRALAACGNANWMRCQYCKAYDDPSNMYVYPHRNSAQHRKCHSERAKTVWSKCQTVPR